MEEKTKIISIAGPTASSKSEIALNLALKFNGEIVNADSIQVYKYFDIGSAKPSLEMRRLVPHHLIDILNPDEEFNAFLFKEMARKAVTEIAAKKRLPIIVGGTGLYIRCFLYDLFTQDKEEIKKQRRILEDLCEKHGLTYLYNELKKIDPKSAEKIHPNDKIRIIRALEFYYATKQTLSSVHDEFNFNNSPYDFKIFVPNFPKDEIVKRIENRTIEIFNNGIVEEVKAILKKGYSKDIKPLKSIGYKEAAMVLDNKIQLEDAIKLTIKNTKAYAKRQKIWFKKEKNSIFVTVQGKNFDIFFDEVKLFLHKFLLIFIILMNFIWGRKLMMNVQDVYLNQLRKERVEVTLKTSAGESISGLIKGFDNFSILIHSGGLNVLVYKHALTSIIPPKEFALKPVTTERESARKS